MYLIQKSVTNQSTRYYYIGSFRFFKEEWMLKDKQKSNKNKNWNHERN